MISVFCIYFCCTSGSCTLDGQSEKVELNALQPTRIKAFPHSPLGGGSETDDDWHRKPTSEAIPGQIGETTEEDEDDAVPERTLLEAQVAAERIKNANLLVVAEEMKQTAERQQEKRVQEKKEEAQRKTQEAQKKHEEQQQIEETTHQVVNRSFNKENGEQKTEEEPLVKPEDSKTDAFFHPQHTVIPMDNLPLLDRFSYDYVFVLECGDKDDTITSNGVKYTEMSWFREKTAAIITRLLQAGLKVTGHLGGVKKPLIFLKVGVPERRLRVAADRLDTDLLIDSVSAFQEFESQPISSLFAYMIDQKKTPATNEITERVKAVVASSINVVKAQLDKLWELMNSDDLHKDDGEKDENPKIFSTTPDMCVWKNAFIAFDPRLAQSNMFTTYDDEDKHEGTLFRL